MYASKSYLKNDTLFNTLMEIERRIGEVSFDKYKGKPMYEHFLKVSYPTGWVVFFVPAPSFRLAKRTAAQVLHKAGRGVSLPSITEVVIIEDDGK